MPEHELPKCDPINALVYEDESSDESTLRMNDPMVIDEAFPERLIGTSTSLGFSTFRHPEGPLWKYTPRKSIPPIATRRTRTPPPTATGETRRQR